MGDRTLRTAARRLLACALLLAAGAARAEGPGVKLGDSLVLHPGVALGVGYDNNVFYASDTPADRPVGAFYMTVRPGLDLSTLSLQRGGDTPHTLDFRLHAGVPIRFFLSSNSAVNQHYSIGVDAGFLFSILPFGAWSVDVFDNYLRVSEPPYAVVQALFTRDQAQNLNYDNNNAGIRLRWRPGGQRFETTLQYTFLTYYFESGALAAKTSLAHDFLLRLKWNFFPKTALYVDVDETVNSYVNSGFNTPPAAYPLRAVAGIIGLITAKLSINANIGYGNSFTQSNAAYPNSTSYSAPIGLAELTWRPTTLTGLTVGYRHDFAQALIGTFYDLDTAYLGFNQAIWRFNLGLRFSWEHRGFHGDLTRDGLVNGSTDGTGANRVDDILVFHGQIDFPIRDYLFISVGDDLGKNFSNCKFTTVGPPCDYLRNDVWLRFSLLY